MSTRTVKLLKLSHSSFLLQLRKCSENLHSENCNLFFFIPHVSLLLPAYFVPLDQRALLSPADLNWDAATGGLAGTTGLLVDLEIHETIKSCMKYR